MAEKIRIYTIDIDGTMAMFQSYSDCVNWTARLLGLNRDQTNELCVSACIVVNGKRYTIRKF